MATRAAPTSAIGCFRLLKMSCVENRILFRLETCCAPLSIPVNRFATPDNAEAIPVKPFCSLGIRFEDRKSTRLNSSHVKISYAVFCLKKKNKKKDET